jgi:Flp pilus assembly protein TadG
MRRRKHGSAVVEMALMMPWLLFLFVGILDFGFYSYAAICTQSAARAAALWTSINTASQTNAIACSAALGELNGLPNMVSVTTCATSAGGVTNALPAAAWVVALSCTSSPQCADCVSSPACGIDAPPKPQSSQAWVTYRTLPMIPIPGVLMSRMTLTRSAEVRLTQQ